MRSPCVLLRSGVVALAVTCLSPAAGEASLTFLGSAGSSTTGRVVVGWTDAGVADSLVGTYGMTDGSLYSGVTLQSSVSKTLPANAGSLEARSSLALETAGVADSTWPVARGMLWLSDYGINSPPARWAQSTLDLALRYTSDQPTIYWAVVENFDPNVPNSPPGPPGDFYMTHPPADSNLWVRWGSVPNTGEFNDLQAVLEAIRSEGQFAYWYYAWDFSVYLDDAPFTHFVADVSGAAPPRLTLSAPRPNPARAGSTIDFALPSPGTVRLEIFDASGRRVNRLVNGSLPAGAHGATWNGTNERGSAVQAGMYFARLAVGRDVLERRLVLLR